jgi:regulator of nucleoside diphosphate kinase
LLNGKLEGHFFVAWIMHKALEKEAMEKNIVVTNADYKRLVGFIEFASLKDKMPAIVSSLCKNLVSAKMLPAEQIGKGIITMNSRVRLKDLTRMCEMELTITYPQDAERKERRISVFSEIGTALFGRKEHEIVYWKTPRGLGAFEIVEVTYQPEASGDYYL